MAGTIEGDYNTHLPIKQRKTKRAGKSQGQKLNINNAFGGSNKPIVLNNNIVSKETYTYKGQKGILVKYDDGSVMFQSKKQVNGASVPYQYIFKNEKALAKNQPSSEILNPTNSKKRTTIDYEYYHNGKVKNKETKNAQNILIQQEHYNKNGKLENRKMYDKKGELLRNIEFTYNKDNTIDSSVYDKNNKLQYTTHSQYKPDGKTLVSSESHYPDGALRSESKYDDKGKIQSSTDYFESGKVKSKTEYWDNGVIKEQEQYDEAGKVTKKISAEIDGKFGDSRQVGEGDCYLMATINSIRELSNGQEMLNNLVKVETNDKGEKIYKVTLPGAQVAAEGLRTDKRVAPEKMYITGEYTFTESELQGILKQAGKKYSLGDGDVILLEAAFEKYRMEVSDTLKNNPDLKSQFLFAGTQSGRDENNILAGGRTEDATFILTGRRSKVYLNNNNVPYGLDYSTIQETGEFKIVPREQNNDKMVKAAVSEVDGKVSFNSSDLNARLDEIMRDGADGKIDNIATVGFRMVRSDGSEGGHAFTLKSVTADSVILINPWDPNKEITMSRADFLQCCDSFTMADTSKQPLTVADVHANPNNPTPGSANSGGNNISHPNGGQNPAAPQNPNSQPLQNNSAHEVKRGDNLWEIAKKHLGQGATATQIANYINDIMKANPKLKWNSAHTSVLIRPGDNIILP